MKERKTPLRMCLSCREMKPKKELLRIVKSPEGEVFVDCTFKANGRGAYICLNKACFAKCVKSKAISRQFNCTVNEAVMTEIAEKVNRAETERNDAENPQK